MYSTAAFKTKLILHFGHCSSSHLVSFTLSILSSHTASSFTTNLNLPWNNLQCMTAFTNSSYPIHISFYNQHLSDSSTQHYLSHSLHYNHPYCTANNNNQRDITHPWCSPSQTQNHSLTSLPISPSLHYSHKNISCNILSNLRAVHSTSLPIPSTRWYR